MLHVSIDRGQARTRRVVAACACMLLTLCSIAAAAQDRRERELQQAAALAAADQHREAAALYESVARRGLFNWDAGLALLAAREYAAAGATSDAERLIDKARRRLETAEDVALLADIEAGLALEANDAPRALQRLRETPTPWPAEFAPDMLAKRAQAEMATGQPVPALRSLEERGALLATPAERAANERMLLQLLQMYPPARPLPTQGVSEREVGWLELPALLAATRGDADTVSPDVAQSAREWLARHPGHPGANYLPPALLSPGLTPLPAGAGAMVALLLPLSSKQRAAALAVRDGFVAGWFASGPAETRPRVLMFDTAGGGAAKAYTEALAAGAQLIVGPLTKEDVAAMVASRPQGLPVPTLALNSLTTLPGTLPPAFLFQFALDPEQEARAVARRIAADGLARGIALFPDTQWGQRVHAAFVDELARTGGVTLTSAQFYPPGTQDFSESLRAALGRFGGAGDRSANRSKPMPTRDAAGERAVGPQFAFVAASPQAARALRPQLRFQMVYDLPLYATSDAWDPSVRTAADMDGLVFPEIPWLLYGGRGAPELWDALQEDWAESSRGRLRLYAFGYDACRLAQQLGSGRPGFGVDGLTGTLELDRRDGHVHRGLEFARIEGGRPQPAGFGPAFLPEAPTNTAGVEPVR
jgi:outer membrane PBP1 activator LpoA protein